MADILFALILLLHPRLPVARAESVADAVVAVTPDRHEQRVLLAADWGETGFGRAGVRFGVTSRRRRLQGQPLHAYAAAALDILRRATRECGGRVGALAGWVYFNTGRCYARPGSQPYAYARAMLHRMWRLENSGL